MPVTFQDVVVIFCTVSGQRNGQLVQISDARKIYGQTIDGEAWSAIQITTAAGVCAVVDLYFDGQLTRHGPGAAGASRAERFSGQSLRPALSRLENLQPLHRRCAMPREWAMKNNLDSTLARLGVTEPAAVAIGHEWPAGAGEMLSVRSPIDGSELATFAAATPCRCSRRDRRGRCGISMHGGSCRRPSAAKSCGCIGERLREHKADLAMLVTLECGKILARVARRSAGDDRHLRFRRRA